MTTNWSDIRGGIRMSGALATFGVAISVTVVALVTHFAFDISWQTSVLLGACISATDAAAVFSVLRVVPLPRRLTGTLEAESGLNDAPIVVLVVAISDPTRAAGVAELARRVGMDVRCVLAPALQIDRGLARYYPPLPAAG